MLSSSAGKHHGVSSSGVPAGREFYERRIRLLQERDAARLVEEQYREDATLVSFGRVVCGRTALEDHFRGYLDRLGDIEVLSTDAFEETHDSIFWRATVRTGLGRARIMDAVVLEGGKIAHHFTAVLENDEEQAA